MDAAMSDSLPTASNDQESQDGAFALRKQNVLNKPNTGTMKVHNFLYYTNNAEKLEEIVASQEKIEAVLLRGKALKKTLQDHARRERIRSVILWGIEVRVFEEENRVYQGFTIPRFFSAVAYKYYRSFNFESNASPIIPALAASLPIIETSDLYNRMKVLAVSGCGFIPKMIMEDTSRKPGEVGVMAAIVYLVDWINYRKENSTSGLKFKDFVKSGPWDSFKNTSRQMMRNCGGSRCLFRDMKPDDTEAYNLLVNTDVKPNSKRERENIMMHEFLRRLNLRVSESLRK